MLLLFVTHLLPRVAALAFALGLAARWGRPAGPLVWLGRSPRLGPTAWRLGCLLLWLHAAGAWWLVHAASWQQMWQHTADVTNRVTGINTGSGVLWNLVALVIWTVDALRPWPGDAADTPANATSSRWRRAGEIYLAFLWLQAAVVFATPGARWVMGLLAVLLGWGIVASRRAATSPGHDA